MSNSQIEQRLDNIDQRIDGLSGAVDTLVTQFLHPLTQQALENQQVIARLIERSEQHQAWLDEDRRDLAEWRQIQIEQSQQIQSLLDSARADRISANERFEQHSQQFAQMQSEIRQNQRLLLAGQERLERNEQRLETNQQQIAATLAEVLSLSRRVQAIEDAA